MPQQAPSATLAAAASPAATATTADVQKTGYTGFGSFHSDDVEVMIRQDAGTYAPPALPFVDPAAQWLTRLAQAQEAPRCAASNIGSSNHSKQEPADIRIKTSSTSSSSSMWGASARNQFLIDFQSWTFINHGAFGGASRAASESAQLWRTHCEAQPLRFIDRELFPQLVRVIRELAAFVNCRPQDLVLLPNATTGLNAVISSMARLLTPADAVFSLDIGYGSVKKMLHAACDTSGATMVTAEVKFPISAPEDIVSLVSGSMLPNTKLAVFDAVTSNTALVLPVVQLVQLCRDRGIPVLIDGAHALGMLPINLQQLQPDFYVSNCHKWLCGARGSASMYVAPQWQQQIQPPVLSHGAEAGFLSRFIWDGCRDYAPLLAISSAVKWWRGLGTLTVPTAAAADNVPLPSAPAAAAAPAGSAAAVAAAAAAADNRQLEACCDPSILAHAGDGGAAARCYMYRLLRQAADMLTARWGTDCLGPASMTAAMTLVRLPEGGVLPAAGAATSADAKYVQDVLHSRYKIEVPIKTIQSTLYVRISAHIYNTLEDYHVLAAAIAELQQQQPQQ